MNVFAKALRTVVAKESITCCYYFLALSNNFLVLKQLSYSGSALK